VRSDAITLNLNPLRDCPRKRLRDLLFIRLTANERELTRIFPGENKHASDISVHWRSFAVVPRSPASKKLRMTVAVYLGTNRRADLREQVVKIVRLLNGIEHAGP
jgi:hypothetical protein